MFCEEVKLLNAETYLFLMVLGSKIEISAIEIFYLIASKTTIPIKLTIYPTFMHCFILSKISISLQFSPNHCFKFHMVSKIKLEIK